MPTSQVEVRPLPLRVAAPLAPGPALSLAIGHDLCREAWWSGARCNWVGHLPAEEVHPTTTGDLAVASLGPDLYAGTAGVALFLARLFARTGSRAIRATALGAIRHALYHAGDLAPGIAVSLHAGRLGIALAAARVARDLGRPGLLGDALDLARSCADERADHLLDLASGAAGGAVALLALHGLAPEPGLLDRAVALGEELAAAAVVDGAGWAWEPLRASGAAVATRPLTGLAHGAAGMGLALVELHRATGRIDFARGALRAFAYEDRLVDRAAGNWPDLRSGLPGGRPEAGPAFAMGWCHGAPGIGLSRLRALQVLGPRPGLRSGARLAVGAVRRRLGELASAGSADLTPCHGIAGLVELLLVAAPVLGAPGLRTLARRHYAAAIRRCPPAAWPCGTASGARTAGLMIGLAGIGYTLLRASDPARVPSVLLVHGGAP